MALAARGPSNDEIADRRVISPLTAKTHRRSGHPRETPVTWFANADDAWLRVASSG